MVSPIMVCDCVSHVQHVVCNIYSEPFAVWSFPGEHLGITQPQCTSHTTDPYEPCVLTIYSLSP